MEEIFKPIPGYNGKYMVSNFGYIFRNARKYSRLHKNKIIESELKFKKLGGNKPNRKGYLRVNLNGKVYFVHTLVALLFIDNPLKLPQVNHKDGNKLNNNVNNLEWVTNQQNRDHAVENKLIAYGEKQGRSKLTLEQVRDIKYLYFFKNLSQKEIAKRFNIVQQTVSKIINNDSWVLALKD